MRNERMFRLLRTHVLAEQGPARDLEQDARQVHAALGEGRCYLAVDALAPAGGFAFWAERDGEVLCMGGEALGDGWTIRAEFPGEADLRLIRDGRLVRRRMGRAITERRVGPGVYRVEAHLERNGRSRTWIMSNPVYLRPSEGRSFRVLPPRTFA